MLITHYHYCTFFVLFFSVGLLGLCQFVLFSYHLWLTAAKVTIWCLEEITTILYLEVKCMTGLE